MSPDLNTCTTPEALAQLLEACDRAYEIWDGEDACPLPTDDHLRAALERVHHLGGHPRAQEVWDEAYQEGHSDGCGRIAREYADIARWLTPLPAEYVHPSFGHRLEVLYRGPGPDGNDFVLARTYWRGDGQFGITQMSAEVLDELWVRVEAPRQTQTEAQASSTVRHFKSGHIYHVLGPAKHKAGSERWIETVWYVNERGQRFSREVDNFATCFSPAQEEL